MNKLQLYITKSLDGFKVLFNINPSEDIKKHVRQLREVVERVKYDPTEKTIFYYISYIESGTFFTIIRTIPTAPADHLAAWIYIPSDVVIAGETLENIINTTARKVSGDKVTTDDVATLREMFGKELESTGEGPQMIPSNPTLPTAWRGINGDSGMTLAEFLDKGLFQAYYLDYNGVLVIDTDLGIEVDATDLSSVELTDKAVVMPAENSAEDFVAHLYGKPLNKPVLTSMGANLAFVWKHAGFEDVITEEVVTKAEFTPATADTSKSQKEISTASFRISSQTGKTLPEQCRITVNDKDVSENPHKFTYAELTSAMVSINCPGFAPYNMRMDLASSTRALVKLQERTKVFCFEMPVAAAELGAPIRFKIYTKRPITISPVEGYALLDDNVLEGDTRTNHLAYVGTSGSKTKNLLFAGAGLAVGLLIGCLVHCGGGEKASVHIDSVANAKSAELVEKSNSSETTVAPVMTEIPEGMDENARLIEDNVKSTTQTTADENNAKVTREAIEYLDNNTAWTKEDLDKHACLKGLYEDMNSFRLEALTTTWATKLADSKQFGRVAQHAKYGMSEKKMAKSGIAGDTFNKNGSTKITIQSYLNRVDP